MRCSVKLYDWDTEGSSACRRRAQIIPLGNKVSLVPTPRSPPYQLYCCWSGDWGGMGGIVGGLLNV
jgi:hypothetical protein